MPRTQDGVANAKRMGDGELRERLLRAAIKQHSVADPFALLSMARVASHIDEAESTLLYQIIADDGLDVIETFRRRAYVRVVERFETGISLAARQAATDSLFDGDPLAEVLAKFLGAVAEQFRGDPSTPYLLAATTRTANNPALVEAVEEAWSPFASAIGEIVRLVAASRGMYIQLDRAHLAELVRMAVAADWCQHALLKVIDFPVVEVDGGHFGHGSLVLWAGLRKHLVSWPDKEPAPTPGGAAAVGAQRTRQSYTSYSTNILRKALDAAVDILLNEPLPAPATPSISGLCKEVGIGASTFYRLYENVEEFREALVIYHLSAVFGDADQSVVDSIETSTGLETNPDQAVPAMDNPEPGTRSGPLSDAECAAIVEDMSHVFLGDAIREADTDYLPWLGTESIARGIATSFEEAAATFVGLPELYLEWTGREVLATTSPVDVMRRVTAVSTAYNLIPTDLTWQTASGAPTQIATYCHVSLVDVLTVLKPGQAS